MTHHIARTKSTIPITLVLLEDISKFPKVASISPEVGTTAIAIIREYGHYMTQPRYGLYMVAILKGHYTASKL